MQNNKILHVARGNSLIKKRGGQWRGKNFWIGTALRVVEYKMTSVTCVTMALRTVPTNTEVFLRDL